MTILVAYDGTPVADQVLAAAEGVGRAAGWGVRILQVADPAVETATVVLPSLSNVELRRLSGAPAETILRAADESDVRVVALGLRSDDRPGFGHVALELIQRSRRMLLAVRPGMLPVDGLRRIIVPLEGSPSTSVAMRLADDVFCRRGREIVMIHVVTGATPDEPGSMPAPRFMDQEHYEWSAWQEEFCMRFSQCSKGGRHRVCVRVGDPGPLIVSEARDVGAELAVVAWRQDFGPGQAALLKHLLEESPCALLLVSQSCL